MGILTFAGIIFIMLVIFLGEDIVDTIRTWMINKNRRKGENYKNINRQYQKLQNEHQQLLASHADLIELLTRVQATDAVLPQLPTELSDRINSTLHDNRTNSRTRRAIY